MRIAYLATADARGHLMRAQLITHALRAGGVEVQLLTTSDEGLRFLRGFGLTATLLSRHYAVQFDAQQNMLREATDANVARYVFDPRRMLRDIWRLRRLLRDHALVINDSFHPALLVMGCLPVWRHRVVHVYGASLRQALEGNFQGRLPGWLARGFGRLIALQIRRARARLEHDFAHPVAAGSQAGDFQLPTPVALAPATGSGPADRTAAAAARAAVYLNPHFRDARLARALSQGLADAGLAAHCVGEGLADQPGWVAQDTDWVARAAHSTLIVSAPGMAALSVAQVYQRPILLVLTDQPEQQRNAERATALGLRHRGVVWQGDAAAFAAAVQTACAALCAQAPPPLPAAHGQALAAARLAAWVQVLTRLAAG